MYRNTLKYQPLIHLTKRFLDFLKKKIYSGESRAIFAIRFYAPVFISLNLK